MARPRKDRRTELMRVDSDFRSFAEEMSKRNNKALTDVTKDIERQMRKIGQMKASIADMIAIPVFFFVIGIMIFAAYYTADLSNNIFINMTAGNPMNDTIVNNGTAKVVAAIGSMDSLYLFIMVASFLAAIISAYYINTHPMAFFFAVVMLIISVITNVYVSNTFSEIAGSSLFATIADNYPYIVTINQNLPLIITAFGALMLIVLFAGKSIRGSVRP